VLALIPLNHQSPWEPAPRQKGCWSPLVLPQLQPQQVEPRQEFYTRGLSHWQCTASHGILRFRLSACVVDLPSLGMSCNTERKRGGLAHVDKTVAKDRLFGFEGSNSFLQGCHFQDGTLDTGRSIVSATVQTTSNGLTSGLEWPRWSMPSFIPTTVPNCEKCLMMSARALRCGGTS
jgi:hypothetical protein